MSTKTSPAAKKANNKAAPDAKVGSKKGEKPPAPENNIDAQESSKSHKNMLLLPWFILAFLCLLPVIILAVWLEFAYFSQHNTNTIQAHKTVTANHLQEIINKHISSNQESLKKLGNNSTLINTINDNNPDELKKIQSILQSSFNMAVDFKIIPWDLSGTAGLKEKGFTPRNNTELMLLSKAGSNKETQAEVYTNSDTWLLSYAAPVVSNSKVIGVLLLTFDKKFLTYLIANDSIGKSSKVSFSIKGSDDKVIASYGDGNNENLMSFDSAFSDGKIDIAFNDNELQQFVATTSTIYIALSIAILLIFIAIIVVRALITSFIKKDSISIQNYADSQKSLHQTKAPLLYLNDFNRVVDSIKVLGQLSTKTGVNPEGNNDYANRPTSKSNNQSVAAADVSEKVNFSHPDIFKEYDIRGIADTQLTTDNCFLIGKAIGSRAMSLGIAAIACARDGRVSSERIQYDVSRGILSTGCNVINIGLQPTPVLYYATEKLETGAGVMITGSHKPAEYNGLKIVLNHKTLLGDEIQDLLSLIESYSFIEGQGQISKQDITNDYIQDITSDIIIAKPLSVVVDAGNGVGGAITSQLLNMLDCNLTELHFEVDGQFPNRGPDPTIASNLAALVEKVTSSGADIGIAYDGDADRMMAVTSSGKIVSSDHVLMMFAKDVVSSHAGCSIVYDVKSSRNIQKLVSDFGGRPIMAKSGHSHIKATLQETNALLGGEFTGHFYFKERWNGFDDGIYAAMRLIELLSTSNLNFDEELANLPESFATDELHIPIADSRQSALIIKKMGEVLSKEQCKIVSIDGIRAEFDNGWGLIRKSNTSNALSLRFEGSSQEDLARIQDIYRKAINQLNLQLSIPF